MRKIAALSLLVGLALVGCAGETSANFAGNWSGNWNVYGTGPSAPGGGVHPVSAGPITLSVGSNGNASGDLSAWQTTYTATVSGSVRGNTSLTLNWNDNTTATVTATAITEQGTLVVSGHMLWNGIDRDFYVEATRN